MSIIEGVHRDAANMFSMIFNASSSNSKDVKPISDREVQETLASETEKRIGGVLRGEKPDMADTGLAFKKASAKDDEDEDTVTLGTPTTMDEIGLKLAKADLKAGTGKMKIGEDYSHKTPWDKVGKPMTTKEIGLEIVKLESKMDSDNEAVRRAAQAGKDAETMFNAIFDK